MDRTAERDIDLLDGDFYVNDPYPTYAWMREHAPVYWDATNELWGISRYDDIVEIEKRKDVFISSDQAKGGYRPNIPADAVDHRSRRSAAPQAPQPRVAPLHAPGRQRAGRTTCGRRSTGCSTPRWGRRRTSRDRRGPRRPLARPDDRQAARLPRRALARAHGVVGAHDRLGGGPRYLDDDGINAAIEFVMASAELFEEKQGLPGRRRHVGLDDGRGRRRRRSPSEVTSAPTASLLLDGGAETTRTVIARTHPRPRRPPRPVGSCSRAAPTSTSPSRSSSASSRRSTTCAGSPTQDVRDRRRDHPRGPAGRAHVLVGQPRPARTSPTPSASTSPASPTTTSPSASAPTSASARRWPASRSGLFFEELLRRVASFSRSPGEPIVDMPNAFVFGLKSAHVQFQPA